MAPFKFYHVTSWHTAKTTAIFALFFIATAYSLTINRAHSRLTSIPSNLDTTVTILLLDHNSIARLEQGDFDPYLMLVELNLNQNGVSFVHEQAFMYNDKLHTLLMDDHRLVQVSHNFASLQPNIRVLELANAFGPVGEHTMTYVNIENYPRLERFICDRLIIENFSIGNLPSLQTLQVTYSRLTEFPDHLSESPNLTRLNIHSNLYSTIPGHALSGLTKLRNLQLHDGELTTLPDMPDLFSLEQLWVHNNRLTTLPDLYYASGMVHIVLRNNPYVCDEAMCWVRMWNLARPDNAIDLRNVECSNPAEFAGILLEQVSPVTMKCYQG